MNYYPVNLDIQERRCVVVGAGGVALRKVRRLLACSARITVVSPQIHPALRLLVEEGLIVWLAREFQPDDLAGAYLVIAATDRPGVNQAVAEEARRQDMLCNVIDQPGAGNFIVPSVVRRGDLMLTVSTSGQSPALSKHLRKVLERQFGNEYEAFLRLMGALRRHLVGADRDSEAHRELFEHLVRSDLIEAIGRGHWTEVRQQLRILLGSDYDEALLVAAGAPDEPPLRQG